MPALMDTTNIPHPNGKKFKFFERHLNNDLDKLSLFLQEQYKNMEDLSFKNITPIVEDDQWLDSASISSIKWREYNVFQFYNNEIYNLLENISDVVKEACNYYDVPFKEQRYMIQGWFNINYAKKGKLDWHNHGGPWIPFFEGYYCVNTEPSVTHYSVFGEEILNQNKDNRMIVAEMGHPHKMGDWDWEKPRITIAYDIVPLSVIMKMKAVPQHWMPLLL